MGSKGMRRKVGTGRHLSAMKRERQNEKRRIRNRCKKAALRTEIKKVHTEPNAETLKATISRIDRTASKGVIPRRRASRMISRLTKAVSAQLPA